MVLRLGGLNNCLFGFAETGAIPEKGMVINMKDIVVIGAGPAGLTAAIYGIRAGYQVTVLEENIYGGQVASTPTVENYPGIESITGVDFSISLYNQATALGAEILFEKLESCDLKGEVKKLQTANGAIEARAVIIANGAKRAKLGCEGEERLTGRGVSYCATCDGAFYKGKEVAIVGGGNTALEDALFLSNNSITTPSPAPSRVKMRSRRSSLTRPWAARARRSRCPGCSSPSAPSRKTSGTRINCP